MQGRGGGPCGDHQGTPQAAFTPSARHSKTGRGGPDHGTKEGAPSEQCALPAHGMQERAGVTPHHEGEGGTPPEQERMPFVHGLIQDMGGNPQELSRPPPTVRQREGGGARGEYQLCTRVGEGAPPPLGGRGAPEEQARAIVDQIVNFPSGGVPHSGQTLEPTQGA